MIITQYCNEHISDLTYLMNQWADDAQYKESELAKQIEDLTQKSDNKIFIAQNEAGKVIGYIFTGTRYYIGFNPFVEVIQLLVDKDNRSQGVGAKLMEYIIKYYKEQGINEVTLHSRIERDRAHEFYRRLGFREFKQSKFFHKHL